MIQPLTGNWGYSSGVRRQCNLCRASMTMVSNLEGTGMAGQNGAVSSTADLPRPKDGRPDTSAAADDSAAQERDSAEPSDALLVARVLGGDREAYSDLVRRYWRMVSVICYQKTRNFSDAEDMAQESFVKAYSAIHTLRDPARFGAWLYNIASRTSIDWLRRKRRELPSVSIDQLAERRLEIAAPDHTREQVEMRDLHHRAMQAVDELPEKYSLVLTLRYVRRMSYREIAEHLGEPAGTVSNRLHRAAEMLRRALAKEGAVERSGSGRQRRSASRGGGS